jgi:methionine-rich copper-binding protein CopC
MPSARIRAAVLGLAVPGVLALTAAPAAAHNDLLSSTPKSGSSVTALPQAVELKFAEAADPRFVKIATTGPDGSSIAMGTPTVAGAVVRQSIKPGTASGTYTVAYRVVSKDGHPVSGKIEFTATLPATTAPASPSASASPSTAPVERVEPKKAAATTDSQGNGWMLYAAIAVGVLLLGGLALMLRARASRTG